MEVTMYKLLWVFAIFSFAGWVIGTAAAAFREKKFVDVGFLFGPWCPAYGFGGVMFAVFLRELKNELLFLFIGGVVLSFLVSLATGFVLEKIFHKKWWDYSRKKFQFGGYVNLPYTVVWGITAVVCVCFVNPFLGKMIGMIPRRIGEIILIVLYIVLAIDFAGTVASFAAVNKRIRKLAIISSVSENLQKAADEMGKGLVGWTLKYVSRAYPDLEAKKLLEARQEQERQAEKAKEKAGVFAVGCSFYKLVCLFFIGAFLGDIIETIFCWITMGRLMSRSSVVYGDFSIVWGLGCVLLTAILYQYRNRSKGYIFIFGTVVGGVYEYVCSVFTEIVFGTVFWDYSKIPFNLGGRINLLFCFFWGIVAVLWLCFLYPRLSRLIEKIPKKPGIILSWIMIVFMLFDMGMSSLALCRYTERHTEEQEVTTAVDDFFDEHFPDERMKQIYPKAILRR